MYEVRLDSVILQIDSNTKPFEKDFTFQHKMKEGGKQK